MDKVVTEITSYCGDTYQKVELARSTFYHRIKKKGDISFLPATNSLSLAMTEVDMLRADLTAIRSQLSIVEGERDQLHTRLVGYKAEVQKMSRRETDLVAARDRAESRGSGEGIADFICYLIDNCEREVIYEEYLQRVYADFIETRAEKAESDLAEATRRQKKSEMLLESSEQLRAGMEAELLQVKGERDNARAAQRIADKSLNEHIRAIGELQAVRDRYREALERIHDTAPKRRDGSNPVGWAMIARAALHPATEAPK